jgi:hypothetical protein
VRATVSLITLDKILILDSLLSSFRIARVDSLAMASLVRSFTRLRRSQEHSGAGCRQSKFFLLLKLFVNAAFESANRLNSFHFFLKIELRSISVQFSCRHLARRQCWIDLNPLNTISVPFIDKLGTPPRREDGSNETRAVPCSQNSLDLLCRFLVAGGALCINSE